MCHMNDHITRKKKTIYISPFMHGSILRQRDKEIEKFNWFWGWEILFLKCYLSHTR